MDRVPHRPLRVLIVRAARDPIADWQAMLLDRLAVDPLVTLVGVVAGQGARTARPGGALLGGILSIERLLSQVSCAAMTRQAHAQFCPHCLNAERRKTVTAPTWPSCWARAICQMIS